MLRAWLQGVYGAWRVLTGGEDHAEDYLRVAETMAKGTEAEFQSQLEQCFCSEAKYSLAEEKFGIELTKRLPQHLQKELAILAEVRRRDSLPALSGRQKLCWALRTYSKDDLRDADAASEAMLALRDAVKESPPQRNAFRKLIQALD